MGWYSDWSFRKNHLISSAPGAGFNYQKRIIVHFSAGVDNGEDVYLDGKCLTNFGDIRFTDKTGVSLLDYWMEKKVDSDYAIFWVEVTDNLIYDVKIFIYYGKAGATSISNGDATFIFFDDFETDLNKWNLKQNASISTDHAYTGTKCVKIEVIGGNSGQVAKILSSLNVAIHAHYYDIESAEHELHALMVSDGAGHDSAIGVLNDISHYEYMPDAFLPTPIDTGIERTVGWHEFSITCHANSLSEPWLGGLRRFFIDGILMSETCLFYANIFLLLSSNGGPDPATGKAYYDTIFLTSFVDPEPSHGTWGIEEIPPGITIFEVEDILKILLMNATTFDEIMLTLLLGAHIVEDPIITLLLTLAHSPPFVSEDIMLSLLATRIFEYYFEFPCVCPPSDLAYFRIAKRLVITADGKVLFI